MKTTEILLFAKLAETTYEDPKTSKAKFKTLGYTIVEFFDQNGAQGYLLKGKQGHVLSFRGTEVTELSDVLADLKTAKRSESRGGLVHRGFQQELDKIWDQVSKSVENIEQLHITGHSLGAAMATIAASRIREKVVALVTFGSPRVGNNHFVDTCTFEHYRVQNNCDDVTKVPPAFIGFRHHTMPKYMNLRGEFKDMTKWQRIRDIILTRYVVWQKGEKFIGLTDHLMANYIKKLEKNIND